MSLLPASAFFFFVVAVVVVDVLCSPFCFANKQKNCLLSFVAFVFKKKMRVKKKRWRNEGSSERYKKKRR